MILMKFPPGVLQFEVGIQTFNEEVGDPHQTPPGLRGHGKEPDLATDPTPGPTCTPT
jgi:hypothetical protein